MPSSSDWHLPIPIGWLVLFFTNINQNWSISVFANTNRSNWLVLVLMFWLESIRYKSIGIGIDQYQSAQHCLEVVGHWIRTSDLPLSMASSWQCDHVASRPLFLYPPKTPRSSDLGRKLRKSRTNLIVATMPRVERSPHSAEKNAQCRDYLYMHPRASCHSLCLPFPNDSSWVESIPLMRKSFSYQDS